MRAVFLALTLASYADAVLLDASEEPATPIRFPAKFLRYGFTKHLTEGMKDGRSGSLPITPNATRFDTNPYDHETADAQQLGEELLKALQVCPGVMRQCEGVTVFGDYSWCALAWPQLRAAGAKNQVFGFTEIGDVTGTKDIFSGKHVDSKDVIALSYGIRERDMWSEVLSNRYQIKSELFDCYTQEKRGPMGDLDLTNPDMGEKPCPSWKEGICYDAPYKVHRTCLGKAKTTKVEGDRSLNFDTIENAVKDRPQYSVHLKLDVEGSEWRSLFEFLNNETIIRKIRTIDMEVHFNKYFDGGKNEGGVRLAEKVDIFKGMARRLAVVGSTVPSLHKIMKLNMDKELRANPNKKFKEPLIYPKNGLDLSQFVVSFVNRGILDQEYLNWCGID